MRAHHAAILLMILAAACTSEKKQNSSQDDSLPSPDTFRTADLLFLQSDQQRLYFQNIPRILPTNKIEKGQRKHRLTEASKNLSDFTFSFKDTVRTLDQFVKQTNVVGLLIIRNDSILFEQYREGITPSTTWISFSVAKSVTSLLYGAALKDGLIESLDQRVSQFVPELVGSAYDSVSLRHLLQMSSGVRWNDDTRDPDSDLMKVAKLEEQEGWAGVVKYLAALKREAAPGQKFNYNTIESGLAAVILKKVVGKSLSEYLSDKIWKPFGMHEDASWVLSRSVNVENGGCCISASLRDYALIGLFALNNGITSEGKEILPATWMQESITPANSFNEYGYYWWLRPGSGRYFASGAFGQQIEIDTASNTIIAVQSHWPIAFNNYYVGYIDTAIESLLKTLNNKN